MSNTEHIENPWSRIAPGYDKYVTPSHIRLANEGLKLVGCRKGMKFLDVAAGSGALSIPAARLGAQVLSTDLSPAMLEHLKLRAQNEGLNLETRVMDGHALELDDNTFDIAGSQFGVMLFPDMPRGIREMTRVIKPGGHVLVHAYGDPKKIDFFAFFVRAIQDAVPDFTGPPLDPTPLPFQLQDPNKMNRVMTQAGLKDILIKTITEKLAFRSGQELWDWLINSNPIVEMVIFELKLSEQQMKLVRKALNKIIDERSGGNDAAILTNPINIGIGTK